MLCPSFCKSIFWTPRFSWAWAAFSPASRPLWQSTPWTPAHMLGHIPVILPQTLAVGYWADKCLNDWDMIFATCWEPLLSPYFLICSFISFAEQSEKNVLGDTGTGTEWGRQNWRDAIYRIPSCIEDKSVYLCLGPLSVRGKGLCSGVQKGALLLSWGEACLLPPGSRLGRNSLWKYSLKAIFSTTVEMASVT